MKFKFVFILSFISFYGHEISAQAIKLTLIENNEVRRTGSNNSSYGIGYEQNLHRRISIFVSAGFEFPDGTDDEYNYSSRSGFYQYGNDKTSIEYSRNHTTNKLTLESRYFFRDNDDASWYIASKISFQKRKEITKILNIGNINQSVNSFHDIEVQGEYSQNLFITPLSLIMGHRSNLEGFIFDFNFGYAFLPKNEYELSIPNGSTTDKSIIFDSTIITFGISIGYGWASY
jgi:hypothetical protein